MAPSVHCYFGAHTEFACYWQCNRPSMFRRRRLQSLGFHIKVTGLAAAAAAVGDKVWNQTQTSQNFTAIPVLRRAHLSSLLQGARTLQCFSHQSSVGAG